MPISAIALLSIECLAQRSPRRFDHALCGLQRGLISIEASMEDIGHAETIIRVLMAVLAGACLGWERESAHKPAGLRTHVLVTLGAAATVIASLKLHHELVVAGDLGGSDPMKAIAGIVGGVGFLGAGSIIRDHTGVRGLTTAATIWLAAAIGVACGLGYYLLAAACVITALTTLVLLGSFEQHVLGTFGIRADSDDPNATTSPKEPPPSSSQ
jgi:putative Mg2+ transporter-C (MgtC) family protein